MKQTNQTQMGDGLTSKIEQAKEKVSDLYFNTKRRLWEISEEVVF